LTISARRRNFDRRIREAIKLWRRPAQKSGFTRQDRRALGAFPRSERNSGVGYRKAPAGQYQIGECEQGKHLCRVLRQAAVARLTMMK
jgi:hypothetical protein